jgi:hypothetical protein
MRLWTVDQDLRAIAGRGTVPDRASQNASVSPQRIRATRERNIVRLPGTSPQRSLPARLPFRGADPRRPLGEPLRVPDD